MRTIAGDVPADRLGVTLTHEHLRSAPPRWAVDADPGLEFGHVDGAINELRSFAEAGGGAVVEMTTRDCGRDVSISAMASAASGVHVIQATGLQKGSYYPREVHRQSVQDIAEGFFRDIDRGMEGTRWRAGVIKVGTCGTDRVLAVERRVIKAAGLVALATGVPVLTHTESSRLGHEQLDVLESAGLDPARVCIGHLDRDLVPASLLSIARRGAWLGMDQWSKTKYAPDHVRVAVIRALVDAGHDRIVVSGDFGHVRYHPSYGGGPGLAGLVEAIRSALGGELAAHVLVTNPARLLSLQPRP
ncbi:phosphotriesterase-related protein [Microbispora rosea subsp. aerata]|nr:phosphotriesterase-related protein [Microbispora rosea subsp. aerata]GIH55758.1 phosphotriesterase-related protein [Microbispora rosea subsp. aerata]GLJ85944.1 phosphotriesterase-related protein [Microbispora rosea subsp. aerata]